MKIFYTASFYGKDKYQRFYDLVLNEIKKNESNIISPELGNYQSLLNPLELKLLETQHQIHYAAIKKGIQWADAVIIEISHEDFQLGHEATLAIQNHKHVLCLSTKEDFSLKIQNRFFHGAKYSEMNIPEIVADFISKTRKDTLSQRFNCFLSPQQIAHLEDNSQKMGVNKSEYLRRLIDKDKV